MKFRGFRSLVFLLSSALAFAQGTTSRLVGTVADSSGAMISGAKVLLANDQTGATFTTQTEAGGNYQFEAIQVGLYTVTWKSPASKSFLSKDNQVTVGAPATVNVTMQIGTLAEC